MSAWCASCDTVNARPDAVILRGWDLFRDGEFLAFKGDHCRGLWAGCRQLPARCPGSVKVDVHSGSVWFSSANSCTPEMSLPSISDPLGKSPRMTSSTLPVSFNLGLSYMFRLLGFVFD